MKKERRFSAMTEQELRDFAQETRSQMKDKLELAEAEDRSLTEDEQKEYDELNRQLDLAEKFQVAAQRSIPLVEPVKKVEERKVHDLFAENLRAAVNEKREVKMQVRSTIVAEDVKDTIPVLFQDVIDATSPALIIEKVGSKMLWNVHGTPTWPTVGDVAANWEGENVALTPVTIDFGALRANPKRLGIEIDISKRALNQSNLSLYNIVVTKIARSFAAAINQALVSFTKVAFNAPEGVFISPALNSMPLSKRPVFQEVVDLETAVMNNNIESDADGFGAYIIGTAMRGKLKSTPVEPGNPRMVLEGDTLNGYPVIVSNYMAQNTIGFGFFEYAAISQFGDLDFTHDTKTKAGEYKVRFVANAEFDITNLRPEAFAVGTVVTASTIYADKEDVEVTAKAGEEATVQVVVKGINLTADVAVTKSGTNASLFAIDSVKFTKDANGRVDGILTITYSPASAGSHEAAIKLASSGATDVTIDLAGTATA